MTSRPAHQPLLALLAAIAFSLLAQDAAAAVLCLSQDPATGRFRGEVIPRESAGCAGDELQIGEVVDRQGGVIELFGGEVRLPEGSFFPDWQESQGWSKAATG